MSAQYSIPTEQTHLTSIYYAQWGHSMKCSKSLYGLLVKFAICGITKYASFSSYTYPFWNAIAAFQNSAA